MTLNAGQGSVRTLERASTFLFVPGTRSERFTKAVASGADVVIIDLEDAVEPRLKLAARANAANLIKSGESAAVRVNGVTTPWFEDDVAAAAGAIAVVLPKTVSAEQIDAVLAIAPTTPVIPLIETPAGVLNASEIYASPNVVRAAFGNVDFAAETGVHPSSHLALLAARAHLVYAASAAGRASPIDGVTTAVDDIDLLRADALHAKELGFTAKLLIHPRQVEPVAHAFSPTAEELAWAIGVIDAAVDGVGLHEGNMIDEPVLVRARRLLERGDRRRGEGR